MNTEFEKLTTLLNENHTLVKSRLDEVEERKYKGKKDNTSMIWWKKSREPLYELARYASQMIEHSPLSPLDKVQLKLKLSDFETELERAKALFF